MADSPAMNAELGAVQPGEVGARFVVALNSTE
jgi:hypothetical protein